MRTTLNIDDDVLLGIKEMAKRESKPAGAVISGLLRQSLSGDYRTGSGDRTEHPAAEFGFRPFRQRGGIVTNELIDRLREGSDD